MHYLLLQRPMAGTTPPRWPRMASTAPIFTLPGHVHPTRPVRYEETTLPSKGSRYCVLTVAAYALRKSPVTQSNHQQNSYRFIGSRSLPEIFPSGEIQEHNFSSTRMSRGKFGAQFHNMWRRLQYVSNVFPDVREQIWCNTNISF